MPEPDDAGPAPDVEAGGDEARTRPEGGPERDDTYHCDLCGAPMLERHCKLVCPACGYQRDCSDP